MRKIRIIAVGMTAGLALAGVVIAPASAHSALCVGGKGCFGTIQAAINAAGPGATIVIGAGTFSGGVRIDKSLRLVGAGVGRTTIKGGGPVLLIESRRTPPSVTVSGLTVRGGLTRQFGDQDYEAFGGGILITPGPEWSVGASVTLDHVRVTDNRTAPRSTYPSPSGVVCPDSDCPYAGSRGGGVASFGNLVVRDSSIDGNTAGGRASDAVGGGIFSTIGSLSVEASDVRGNTAAPEANTIGRYAEGGGLFVDGGSLTVRSSRVNANKTNLETLWPTRPQGEFLNMNGNSGGIHVGDDTPTLIADTEINDNRLLVADPNGEPSAINAALLVGVSPVVVRHTVIKGNSLTLRSLSTETEGPLGGTAEVDAHAEITDTQIVDNTTTVITTDGPASATGGLTVFNFANRPEQVSLTRVTLSGNTTAARSAHGTAAVLGATLLNSAAAQLRDVTIANNLGTARGTQATAQGGGIWNGMLIPGDVPQAVSLDVHGSRITGNSLTTAPQGDMQGGGIYSIAPMTLATTLVAGNQPDNCFGCDSTVASPSLGEQSEARSKGRSSRVLPGKFGEFRKGLPR